MSATALAHLIEQGDSLGVLVAGLEPDNVPASEAPGLWQAFERIERLAAAGKTLLARRVDESRVWQREGHRHPADYLAQHSGASRGAARASLATSKRLRDLPRTGDSLRRGELSSAQADTISDAAAANPEAEQSLLGAAGRLSLAELRERCARSKAAADPDPDATHRRLRAARRLRRYTDPEGAWNLVARGTPETGAFFNTVLDPIIDELFHASGRDGARAPHEAVAFDALIELARRARGASGASAVTGVEPGADIQAAGPAAAPGRQRRDPDTRADIHAAGAASAPGRQPAGVRRDADAGADASAREPAGGQAPGTIGSAGARGASGGAGRQPGRPRSDRVNPTYLALLRVDVEALIRGATRGDEQCEIPGVGPVPVRVARELLGDAVVKLVITRGVDVLNVTHLGWAPTAAQRIALLWQSPGCIVEGCPNRWVEIDHRVPWAQTRHTRLDELDRACKHHHRLKTLHGWALVPGTGPRPMVPPDDPRHPDNQLQPATGPGSPAAARHDTPTGPETTDTGPSTLFDNRTDATDAGTGRAA